MEYGAITLWPIPKKPLGQCAMAPKPTTGPGHLPSRRLGVWCYGVHLLGRFPTNTPRQRTFLWFQSPPGQKQKPEHAPSFAPGPRIHHGPLAPTTPGPGLDSRRAATESRAALGSPGPPGAGGDAEPHAARADAQGAEDADAAPAQGAARGGWNRPRRSFFSSVSFYLSFSPPFLQNVFMYLRIAFICLFIHLYI